MALPTDDASPEMFDDDLRCSVWTAGQGYDPIGSATRFDRLVLVEVPQPWPKDVADLDWISPLAVPDGTRVQAIVPDADRTDGALLLTRWDRSGGSLTGTDWLVPAADVAVALAEIVAGHDPGLSGEPAPAEVLVCSHGSRDRCCGGPGTRVAAEARTVLAGEVRVRRTSHTGGHRFAPTAITLPEGRVWGFLDAEVLAGIVRRDIPPAEAREFYRGLVLLDPWAQVVEGAVLEQRGWGAVDFDAVAATMEVDGDRAAVALAWTAGGLDDEMAAVVEISTRYPVLQCGHDPSHATKTAPAYRLVGSTT